MSALFHVTRARMTGLDGDGGPLLKPSIWVYRCDVCQRMGIERTQPAALSALWHHVASRYGVRL